MTALVIGIAGDRRSGGGMRWLAQSAKVKGGFIVQRDAEIAKNEPGTHNGGGQTIGYSFFDKTPGMKFVFRKRAAPSGRGRRAPHEQHEDEVLLRAERQGRHDGRRLQPVEMTPGTAVLTRPGSSHVAQAGRQRTSWC